MAVGTSGAIRAGSAAHPLLGWIEIADVVESAKNSNVWKPNLTYDGVQPTAPADALMAAAFDTTLLR